MPVTDAQVTALLTPLGTPVTITPLSGGLFATVLRADLDDGRRVVVKVLGADTSRLLSYEHGVLGTEALADRLAHAAGLPVPALLLHDTSRTHVDGDAIVTTFLDGALWSGLDLDDAGTATVRRALGGFMADLHALRGQRFGYPAPESGLSADTWPRALSAMVDAVLADAVRWGVDLPADRLRAALRRHHDVLAAVDVPRLVHADLWPGNLLLGDDLGVVGVLDAERALWADPLFELAGCDQLGAGAVDPDVLAGYRAGGGRADLGDGTPGDGDPDAWTRLRLCRAYVACLLAVEVVPRAYEGDWVEGYVRTARTNLDRLLDELGV
ncbi:phosphotransferase family enzyme [Isoptericola jiangsuensis]|uniref:Phosphotransferase family enzyme n=2 Tax=Isoptericola jiangsuensis TaxID=548579 RepID=A0A2A9ERW0_9MICO|nr:phosphotransferase family enzyme [Isoptericola jiangsuensis]